MTAGVLKGERSRFQLFGDTVNTGKDSSRIILGLKAIECESQQHISQLPVWNLPEFETKYNARFPRLNYYARAAKEGG